jgi:hypothetical protein
LGNDRNITDRYIYTATGCGEARLVRHPHPRHHDQVCRCRRSIALCCSRREGRDLHWRAPTS